MDRKIPEFENFLIEFKAALRVKTTEREDIVKEINQSIYDKFNNLIVNGCDVNESIAITLDEFGTPKELAEMFNSVYIRQISIGNAIRFAYDKKVLIAAIITIIIMRLAI